MSYTKEEIAIKLEEIIRQAMMTVYFSLTENNNYKSELNELNKMYKDFLDMIQD